jgi:hypothetical protein
VIGGQVAGRNATLAVDGRTPRDVLACPAGRGKWRFRRS